MRERCIWEFPNIGTKKQRKGYYTAEAVSHPAKMPIYLVDAILDTYCKPGDVVLDPMSGIGSTIIQAGRKGMVGIAVEFERKFVDLTRQSIELAKDTALLSLFDSFIEPMIIWGDARALPLRSVDVVVTSPPYAENIGTPSIGSVNKDNWGKEGKSITDRRGLERGYSKNPDNIGNLKHGSVDAVLTSPPYSQIRMDGGCTVLGSEKHSIRPYSDEPIDTWQTQRDQRNIGNLKHGDISAVVMSPPHGNISTPTAYSGRIYRLALTDLEKAVDEAEQFERENVARGAKWAVCSRDKIRAELSKAGISNYSKDEANIGNRPYGKVDACIFSPPYANSLQGEGNGEDWADRMEKFGSTKESRRERHTPGRIRAAKAQGEGYSKSQENIGNHPYGAVDACVFSPPFEKAQEGGGIMKSGYTSRSDLGSDWISERTYSADKFSEKNISNEKGNTYLSAMLIVYSECHRVLRPGGLMILVLKNFVRNKKIVRLDLDTRKLCEAAGFSMLPCPEGCEDQGHTHLRKITSRSFWINNLVNNFYALEGLAALGQDREKLSRDRKFFKKMFELTFGGLKAQDIVSFVRREIPDWEPPPCPYEEASKYEQIQVYQKKGKAHEPHSL